MSYLKKILPEELYYKLLSIYHSYTNSTLQKSYSQEGEDLILSRILDNKKNGFYIDVGAYHPKRFSNTYKFYRRGWRGINVDARPGSMKLFNILRPRDINLEIPVADSKLNLEFYIFNEPAVSGFLDKDDVNRLINENYRLVDKILLQTQTLEEILENNLPAEIKEIDFISIDVEGYDYKVLKSNNWNKYRPFIVLIEDLTNREIINYDSEISLFMKKQGYTIIAKTMNTYFYKKIPQL